MLLDDKFNMSKSKLHLICFTEYSLDFFFCKRFLENPIDPYFKLKNYLWDFVKHRVACCFWLFIPEISFPPGLLLSHLPCVFFNVRFGPTFPSHSHNPRARRHTLATVWWCQEGGVWVAEKSLPRTPWEPGSEMLWDVTVVSFLLAPLT